MKFFVFLLCFYSQNVYQQFGSQNFNVKIAFRNYTLKLVILIEDFYLWQALSPNSQIIKFLKCSRDSPIGGDTTLGPSPPPVIVILVGSLAHLLSK